MPVHCRPQAPQLARSAWRIVHTPPQRVVPMGQVQAPFWQNCPPLQTVPQAPQLLGANWVLTHAPLQ
jgi:hypothetical protein